MSIEAKDAPLPLAGRVYIGPEPDVGPHPGFRGPIRVDALGVQHIDFDCEWLFVKDTPAGWPDSEWEPVEREMLVPWHRVNFIEWATAGDPEVPEQIPGQEPLL